MCNFAVKSAAVTLKYKLSPSLSLCGSAKYESDRYVGQPDTAAGDYKLPSYTVVDVFATYKWDRQTTVRLNVANLADKDYLLAGYRSGDFLYKGEGRNAKVTVSYDF